MRPKENPLSRWARDFFLPAAFAAVKGDGLYSVAWEEGSSLTALEGEVGIDRAAAA